jgi:peptidoglycan/xylan/chitin deacetylase (PgdA/CDA1 family)
MACKSVMYHYVRERDPLLPELFYLDVGDFERQLDYFEKNIGFVSKAQWLDTINNPAAGLPDGVILTFDDGIIDHYRYVYPILKARGIWGIFYISTETFQKQHLLNVHRVHYLLGRFGGEIILKKMESLLSAEMFIEGFYDRLKSMPYASQSMDEVSLRVKKIVNYALKPEFKSIILKSVIEQLNINEPQLACDYYINTEHIREMSRNGFMFGAHGASHNLLTKFQGDEIQAEIGGAIDALNNVLDKRSNTFCYPYGGTDSWNEQILSELKNNYIEFGFCVESRDITLSDLKNRALTLPRYDCNEFPYGKARRLSQKK